MNSNAVMVDVATKDLSGAALDWAVAIAMYGKVYVFPDGGLCPPEGTVSLNEDDGTLWTNIGGFHHGGQWCPSTDWGVGSQIIAGALISLLYEPVDAPGAAGEWCAWLHHDSPQFRHQDQLVAGSRALVASKMGDIVKVPAYLVLP